MIRPDDPNIAKPLLRVEFRELESWNNFLGVARHFGAAAGMMSSIRNRARKAAIAQGRRQGFAITELVEYGASETGRTTKKVTETFTTPLPVCSLTVRYWRPTNRRYDVCSPLIKPVVDGFVDAGVFEDDDQTRLVSVTTVFMGVDSSLKLSKEAMQKWQAERAGKKKKPLTPSRFWFDFYPAPEPKFTLSG